MRTAPHRHWPKEMRAPVPAGLAIAAFPLSHGPWAAGRDAEGVDLPASIAARPVGGILGSILGGGAMR